MSRETFHHPTVPHYCSTDTPRGIPKYLRPLPEFIGHRKAQQMMARKYVRKWITDNWKKGDHFIIAEHEGDPLRRKLSSHYVGKTGTFDQINQQHPDFPEMVVIIWDKEYEDTPPRMGVFNFYHYAIKTDITSK